MQNQRLQKIFADSDAVSPLAEAQKNSLSRVKGQIAKLIAPVLLGGDTNTLNDVRADAVRYAKTYEENGNPIPLALWHTVRAITHYGSGGVSPYQAELDVRASDAQVKFIERSLKYQRNLFDDAFHNAFDVTDTHDVRNLAAWIPVTENIRASFAALAFHACRAGNSDIAHVVEVDAKHCQQRAAVIGRVLEHVPNELRSSCAPDLEQQLIRVTQQQIGAWGMMASIAHAVHDIMPVAEPAPVRPMENLTHFPVPQRT